MRTGRSFALVYIFSDQQPEIIFYFFTHRIINVDEIYVVMCVVTVRLGVAFIVVAWKKIETTKETNR